MLGRYRVAVEDNTDSYWKEEENQMLMNILVVSLSNSRIEMVLTSIQENDPADVPPPSPLVASAIPPSFHSRSLSGSRSAPASRSVSVSRSVSGPTWSPSVSGSRSPSVASSAATVAAGGPAYKKFSKEEIDNLLQYLGIDIQLPLASSCLQGCYKKHCAIVNATEQVLKLGRDAEWLALEEKQWVPPLRDFIEIFVAKTQYYGTWKKAFDDAVRFPALQDWLAMEEDRKSDRAIWGVEKGSYSFEDLKDYIRKKKRERELAEREAGSHASGSHAESRESSDRKGKKKNKKTRKDSSE